jgi:benzoate/toluate 1,2-dioxygenase reductase subunit
VPDALTLTVCEVSDATPTARRLVIDLCGVQFAYQAGQGASLGLHGQRERRPYSIASAPADSSADGTIEFLLRTNPGGGLGRHLEGARPGSRVDFEGPFGSFVLPEVLPDGPLLFVAGGTGLAPLRSLAREARARGHRGARHLIYSVKEAADIAYREELARWSEDHRGEAIVTVTRQAPEDWAGRRGRVDLALLRQFASDAPLCFLCGPGPMVDDLSHHLSQLGIPADHVRTEQWAPVT